MPDWWQQIDESVLLWVHQGWRAPWADAFFAWITDASHFLVPLGLVWMLLLVFGGRRGRVTAILLAVTLVLTDQISSHVLKPWVDRVRPCFEVEGVEALIPQVRSCSFPSSHAANTFGAAAVLALSLGGWWRLAYLPALLVSLSRVYLGVHYPSDVAAGALLGLILGWLLWAVAEGAGLLRPEGSRRGGIRGRPAARRPRGRTWGGRGSRGG